MLKRFAIVILAALMLAACGSGQGSETPTSTALPTADPAELFATQTPEFAANLEEWEHYPEGTLADLQAYAAEWVADHDAEMMMAAGEESGPYMFDPGETDASLIRADVQYTGNCRPIGDAQLLAMTWWVGTNKPELRDLFLESFKQECRYLEGETEVWLPTQEIIIEDQKAGLLNGQTITVYVQYLGAIVPEQGDPQQLYIVNFYWVEPSS